MTDTIETTRFHPTTKKIFDLALSLHHATRTGDILEQLFREMTGVYKSEVLRLFNYDAIDNEVYTMLKFSDAFAELTFPVNDESLAGYTALHKKTIALNDIKDKTEISKYKGLNYDNSHEFRTGVKVKSIISVPLLTNDSHLTGIIQLINLKKKVSVYLDHLDFLVHIGKVVASALFHHDHRQHRGGKFDLLIEEGLISQDEFTKAIQQARKNAQDPIQGDPVSVLMDRFHISPKIMQASLSRYYMTDFLAFEKKRIFSPDIVKGVNTTYFRKNFIVPLELKDETLSLLVDNPFNGELVNEIKQIYQAKHCRLFVGFRRDILKYIDRVSAGSLSGAHDPSLDLKEAGPHPKGTENHFQQFSDESILDEDAPLVVQVVNKLILDAYDANVSDIHIEPGPGNQKTIVRFRKDGACFEFKRLPIKLSSAVINRVKVMSQLKIDEHRFPQSGKIRLKYGDSTIELRVEITPTVGRKEDVVMRILAGGKFLSIDDLGLSETNKLTLLKLIAKPYGILLAVGPTGSGKTTTLHALLHHLNCQEKKIWTVEDPVEITQPGLRQVQVNYNIKPRPFDFPTAMRSFLRSDPDIIMVGEMRDKETATIALEASLTGHLVLSTLHTNSAPETITRLIEMGIDPLNVADSLLGVLAQRLVRLLCEHCKEEYVPDSNDINALVAACGGVHSDACGLTEDVQTLFRPRGCDRCHNTGFKGRVGIHELLPATPAVKGLIIAKQSIEAIRQETLGHGMGTLKMDGIRRVIAGQTTLAEVLKVCIE